MTAKLFLSPRIRKSPYFEATRRYGAKEFSVYNKMYLPMGYSDPETEFWNLVNNVNLWDVAAQRIVEITENALVHRKTFWTAVNSYVFF